MTLLEQMTANMRNIHKILGASGLYKHEVWRYKQTASWRNLQNEIKHEVFREAPIEQEKLEALLNLAAECKCALKYAHEYQIKQLLAASTEA